MKKKTTVDIVSLHVLFHGLVSLMKNKNPLSYTYTIMHMSNVQQTDTETTDALFGIYQ
jgi:hypothetical protein